MDLRKEMFVTKGSKLPLHMLVDGVYIGDPWYKAYSGLNKLM
jgi:hypothetical protein